MLVLTAFDVQLFLETQLTSGSARRLALTAGLALATYLAITSDVRSRWTYNLTHEYLTEKDAELAGWLPDRQGIFYTADMNLFYQTFLKNPKAEWRYILGFEPAAMPDEDFAVYRRILWNFGDSRAYQPWLDKMRPADRLVIRGDKGARPQLPELEWKYAVSGTWIGRLPRTNAPAMN